MRNTRAELLRAARRTKMADAVAQARASIAHYDPPPVRGLAPLAAVALAIDAHPDRIARLTEAEQRLRVKRVGEVPLAPCLRCRERPRAKRSPYCLECDWTLPSRR